MSPKLPVLSGEDLIRILEKFGYVRVGFVNLIWPLSIV